MITMFLPLPLIYKRRDICLVKGCGKSSNGRSYCNAHMDVSARRALTKDLSALIRSDCCDAACFKGEVHDNGEQYCSKCKQPCCWKVPTRAAARE
jgi:hypothetical protein